MAENINVFKLFQLTTYLCNIEKQFQKESKHVIKKISKKNISIIF